MNNINEKLIDIVDSYWPGFLSLREMTNYEASIKKEMNIYDLLKMVREAYQLGQKSKKCKEDPDNPYNIDYDRQTNLFE